ncbi:MAG: hypothetical protein A3C80_03830 [Candidatus Ryanbacteria bacterium RIFCSPHIGHO2_02_FULL_45_43]|uniref:Histidine--tRNA ligase n=1 Tax=Candidatus Ryanbacteria bacterium RIFCSPHIGHO2_01_45_13 TaxID=1802112 RepID=A0A1G2FYI5_9BACT|nr:MAG: hypothetical protein A2718_03090 [Candidatus Ryanbacteria bacterium RIFCSPHIGHO2_01_FULL_44_130]OGZ43119.1 MAG: hypothetical protein A2W41_00285 [Candidatus Ryanbacteria bacterium RIFCSPHIGHO2_01_45_13]OGZ47806.1 MAG: hypothetical protein A3C80_03830 [Candidatus Ryanbacteria bacterium RIFCSPHIGHO2_02_FULL_45_43]OGZ49699.1 MAG: hypothetical protein A3E55_02285 [Candidatus Ryanbacteria bacterium RIFCSPHIGHO2_12_FULL_44_20]OGZ52192.1 MAG: hypothetical protein A3A17_03150 [Candidatus Ryanba
MIKRAKKEPLKTLKGMHDILPDSVPYYDRVIRETRKVAEYYGFQTIRTPHIERLELFTASLGNTSDVVQKQMYTFRVRGGTPIVLRPEGTAPLVRAYFEHGMQSWPQPVQLFYNGSFFRHENPQAGRTREFQQCGLEVIGEMDSIHDALVVRVLYSALEALHLRDVIVHINSIGDKNCRPQYRKEISAYFRRRQQSLCRDCKKRLRENPLRILDCKNEDCVAIKEGVPQMIDFLCEFCKAHFKSVLEYLDEIAVPYSLDPYLVRGFDYYTKTVFEFFMTDVSKSEVSGKSDGEDEHTKKEKDTVPANQEKENKRPAAIAIGSGGRYDDLANMFYGRAVPGVGGALGVDRVVAEMKARNLKVRPEISPKVFLIQLGGHAKKKSFLITEELRKGGISFTHQLSKDSLRGQLKAASRLDVPYVLIIGQKEAVDGKAILREMTTGTQEIIPFAKIVSVLKLRLKQ